MTEECETCAALFWRRERGDRDKTQSCCASGAIDLPHWNSLPNFLRRLLTDPEDLRAKHFRDNIRRYNAAHAFTSIKCEDGFRAPGAHGPKSFQIHGQLYHRQGPLEPDEGCAPVFAQIYIYDPAEAARYRIGNTNNAGLDPGIMIELTDFLHAYNPHIATYLTARERLYEMLAQSQDFRLALNPDMQIVVRKGADLRRENRPTTDGELAAILPNQFQSQWRDIVLAYRGQDGIVREWATISPKHPAYLALAYPLMFPFGDKGFDIVPLLRHNGKEKNISLCQYYRYYLYPRHAERVIPFCFGWLFQTIVVDMWAQVDQEKVDFLASEAGQKQIRAEVYGGLQDAVRRGEFDAQQMGRRVILPASHLGSPRYMANSYQDSMAIVRHCGHPTLFITATANPNWDEIKRELLPGQTANDRPDVVVRVFRMKVKELLEDLRHNKIFGDFDGWVWVIEYQKRGLPHVHILLFLHADDRRQYLNAETIDRVICAELPTAEMDPDGSLREIIISTMLHGPCGDDDFNAPCMQVPDIGGTKTCRKKFPKEFSESTVVNADGYPIYRRRDNGDKVTKTFRGKQATFDNRHVVPYSPFLSKKYRAHINVELCASIKSIKYLHKYHVCV